MLPFDFDWCYLVVDANGHVSIRDVYEGLEIYSVDSIEEAIAFLAE